MTHLRWQLLAASLLVSVCLAFFLRGLIYEIIVVPLAYLFWLGGIYYSAIPQAIVWILLTVVLVIALVWNFVPEVHPTPRTAIRRKVPMGQVEALAVWMHKSRIGNYSKWQLARRLGRIARQLGENPGRRDSLTPLNQSLAEYLDAGLNHSFADFPSPGNRFQRRAPTPLNLDPKAVVDYLESLVEMGAGRYP